MRYFFISDVHGEFSKMRESLESANFDYDNDTLVSVGDLFDRGDYSYEILEYIMNCPHHIIILGNHDLRLYELLRGIDTFTPTDKYNGTDRTLRSFANIWSKWVTPDWLCEMLRTDPTYKYLNDLINRYFREAVFAVEFDDLIATHGWTPLKMEQIPVDKMSGKYKTIYKPFDDWRQNADSIDWYSATWANTEEIIAQEMYPDKTLLVGHWHTFRLRDKESIDCSIFTIPGKLIAIDGCSNWEFGCVNTYIYESDEEPKVYAIPVHEIYRKY